MESYKDLIVWQKSFLFTKSVYLLTAKFPMAEVYGITSQLRRASVSIVSNIAEGFSRKNTKEYIQFLSISFASTSEVETQLLLAKELQMAVASEFVNLESSLIEIRKMLVRLLQVLKSK
jgi:four helix bundle protein